VIQQLQTSSLLRELHFQRCWIQWQGSQTTTFRRVQRLQPSQLVVGRAARGSRDGVGIR
ncbi:unnamed protein product, partial [Amoebophrya sp. A25]